MNIEDLMSSPNIAEDLEDQELSAIYLKCQSAYDNDKNSMAEWIDRSKMIIELASLKYKEKDYPYKGAANTTYPLMTTAVVQAASHITLNLVNKGKMVLGKSIGFDPDGSKEKIADAVSKYINWQLLEDSDGCWEDSTDRMLTVLLLIGTVFKKTYYDPISGKVESKYWAETLVVRIEKRE